MSQRHFVSHSSNSVGHFKAGLVQLLPPFRTPPFVDMAISPPELTLVTGTQLAPNESVPDFLQLPFALLLVNLSCMEHAVVDLHR